MKLSLIIFLSLLIFIGTAKNHTSTEDFSKVLVPVNDEKEEEEEANNDIRPFVHEVYVDKGISEHQPEDSDGDDALKLHNSLQSLREYLEMLNSSKDQEPTSKEESIEDNKLGPHYHTMNTNEPPMEMLPEELQDQENVGDNPPKDLYFQPIPISDKISMAERNSQVGTGGGPQIRETVLLAVASATLAVLLLLTMFCAAAVYCCSKPYRYFDDFSLTSSEKQRLFCPSDSSSYTRTEDSSLLWNGRLLAEQSSSEIKDERTLPYSFYIDEISTFSDESVRTVERDKIEAERDKTEAEQYGLAEQPAPPPSVPPPAEEAPPAPVPAEEAPPPAAEAPPPAAEAPPPAAEAPPPAAEAPPEPPPAEEAPPPEAPPPPAEEPPPE